MRQIEMNTISEFDKRRINRLMICTVVYKIERT